MASNILETSDEVSLNVRVLGKTEGLTLVASKESLLPREEVELTIAFQASDEFTCYTLNSGDGDKLLAFGNENTCYAFLDSQKIKYHSGDSKR